MPEEPQPLTAIERARRSQIIAGAAACISKNGYSAASLTAIAKEAGVGKGVILYHFGNKDTLIEAVLKHVYTQADIEIGSRVRAETTPKGLLYVYISESFAFISSRRDYVIALLLILADGHAASNIVSGAYQSSTKDIQNILEFGQREGVFRAFDAGEVAKMIRTLIDVASYTLRDNPEADLSAYAREARTFIKAAIYP
jgi:AcrR family transcriptional regulator